MPSNGHNGSGKGKKAGKYLIESQVKPSSNRKLTAGGFTEGSIKSRSKLKPLNARLSNEDGETNTESSEEDLEDDELLPSQDRSRAQSDGNRVEEEDTEGPTDLIGSDVEDDGDCTASKRKRYTISICYIQRVERLLTKTLNQNK
jgi:hypothetical protein